MSVTGLKKELPAHSQESLELVADMISAGWRLRRSKKGEAILYPPDGGKGTTVARKDQSRGLKNARAAFERWKRGQE